MLQSKLETKVGQTAFVRLGWQGEIACVEALTDAPGEDNHGLSIDRLRRGDRVVVELETGQQVAEFLTSARSSVTSSGRLLRLMKPEDELRLGHLRQFARQALEKFNTQLDAHEEQYCLLDAEPLLDGATLLLRFVHPNVPDEYSSRILRIYEEETRSSEFYQKVEKGCGPDCGTTSAKIGCSTCVNCSVKCTAKRSSQDRRTP